MRARTRIFFRSLFSMGSRLQQERAVKISALPRTCLSRYRGCNKTRAPSAATTWCWPDSDSGVLAAGMALRAPQKRQAGQPRPFFIQNTRTLNQYATSLRVILLRHRSTRRPRAKHASHGPVSLKQKAWQGWRLWLLLPEHAPSPCRTIGVIAGAAIFLARLHFFALTRLH